MIDPEQLQNQRNVFQIRPGQEYQCPGCGRRTRDRSGQCRDCRVQLPIVSAWSTVRIAALVAICRAELKKRKADIETVLKGA